MSKRDPSQDWRNVRQAVFARDRDRCLNCRASKEVVMLDVDHGVPRGAGGGGADRVSNQNSYCRRCHDAKHEKCIAPSVQLQSTGQMTDREFGWFKHFVDEMIPAMSQAAGGRVIPKFNLDDEDIWYLPIGNVIHLDEQLADDSSIEYMSASLEDYM